MMIRFSTFAEIYEKADKMKTQTKLNKVTVIEIIKLIFLLLLLFNGVVYLIFTLILKMPFIELFSRSWIILIFVPLIQGIGQSFMNRNGTLLIESNDKSKIVIEKIEELLNRKGYQSIGQDKNQLIFDYKSKWSRIVNLNRGIVKISLNEYSLNIFAGRNILYLIETKIKYANNL
jgi:hypothetical protein